MTVRIGLVLGAGGLTGGAFHAGALAALADETGWDPRSAEVVVGTSAGALTGAVLRAGLSADDLRRRTLGRPLSPSGRRLTSLLTSPPDAGFQLRPDPDGPRRRRRTGTTSSLARMALRPWNVRPASVISALLPPGQASTAAITGGIEPLFGQGWPDPALWVCAVRLDDGRRVVFGRDDSPTTRPPVGTAVAASCAVPWLFEPVTIDGVEHVDGGVHSPTNLDVAAGIGLDLVIVSSPMSQGGRPRPTPTPDWALRRFCRAQLDAETARVRRRRSPVLVLQPNADVAAVMGPSAMDASRRVATVDATYEAMRRYLRRADVRERVALLA